MDLVSVKIPAYLRRRIAAEARRRGVSQSAVIRESLGTILTGAANVRGELSCADLAADLLGSLPGPRDASTHPRYLEQAIMGSSTRRGRRKRRR